MIKDRGGLEAALSASLVETLIGLLGKGKPPEVQREASVTLALACFDDMAKIIAIQVKSGWLGVSISCGGGDVSAFFNKPYVVTRGDWSERSCNYILKGCFLSFPLLVTGGKRSVGVDILPRRVGDVKNINLLPRL